MDSRRRFRRFRVRSACRRAHDSSPTALGRLALVAAALAALALPAGPAAASQRTVLGELFSADG